MDEQLIDLLRQRVVEGAVGPTALRNQGRPRVVEFARKSLKKVNVVDFVVGEEEDFKAALDRETEAIRRSLPVGAKNWGAARKALNLFLRDILYNQYLSNFYKFNKIERWLEVPLDSNVVEGIEESYLANLPKWKGIKHLKAEDSFVFQQAALKVAKARQIARVHLDVYWWRRLGKRSRRPADDSLRGK
jgi:hypothetical protein